MAGKFDWKRWLDRALTVAAIVMIAWVLGKYFLPRAGEPVAGEAIPFLSRLLAVADVYDAMASGRAYRQRIEEAVVLETIRERAGSHFDPQVVAVLMRLRREGRLPAASDP